MSKNAEYVSKADAKRKREGIMPLLTEASNKLRKSKGLPFSRWIVGSARRNMIIQFGNSLYDTDIELVLSGKEERVKEAPASIKKDIYDILKPLVEAKKWKIEMSTSVITVRKFEDGKETHSFDLAVARRLKNMPAEKSVGKTDGDYVWNQIPDSTETYSKWKDNFEIIGQDTKGIYKEKRQKRHDETNDDKNKEDYISSSSLFVESVNEACDKAGI